MRWRDLVTGIVLLLGVASSAFSAGPGSAPNGNERQREPHRVVLLYDERTDLPGLAMLDASLLRNLTADPSRGDIEVYREEIELSRFPSSTHLPRFAAYLRDKYSAKRIDAVVAVLGPSLDFLLAEGRSVFPGVPIVFCGIDRRELERRVLPDHVTGVLLKRQFAPTLRLALDLHPGTTRVVLVAGTSEFDARLVAQARQEFREFEGRVAITYLTSASLPDILNEVSHLPPQTLLLYTTMFRDAAGSTFIPHDVAERLSAAANVPMYGFLDQFVGKGIVGGRVYSTETHGQQASELVREILNGRKPSALPIVEATNSNLMFDWHQMQRWGVREARLPVGSAIRFRELSMWQRYRSVIIVTAAVVVLQMGLIIALLLETNVRRRAQIALRDNEAVLKARTEQVRDLAGQLITAQEVERARIARELHDDIGQRIAAFSISISGLKRQPLVQTTEGLRDEVASLQTRTIDLSESVRHLSHDLHPATLQHAGISSVLRSHCAEFARQHGSEVIVNADLEPDAIDATVALCLFRVTQEALQNIARHAAARHVEVSLTRSATNVELSIADDGAGFDPERAHLGGGGLGLQSIRERVRMARGRLMIDSAPGRGTTVWVSVAASDAEGLALSKVVWRRKKDQTD
jgi:signal transduction histidine kinase